ncbi:MAG: cysteine desulfurase NifS [Bacillota bacterium]
MKSKYFDHAATTPVRNEVIEEMVPFFNEIYGNASSVHLPGQKAAGAVDDARQKIADLIGADRSEEIIFTSGGTEADNLAIKGAAMALKDKGNHIITSTIEHHAVLHTCEYLEKHLGFDVTYLEVDENGFVDPEKLRKSIRDDTILISIMMANNEIGTIEPVEEIAEIAEEYDILFHTDAVQAAGQIPVDVVKQNIDMLSLSAHKFNGPKGVGALYVKKGIKLVPQSSGGAQERKRRAGTENVPGIVGMGKAAEIAKAEIMDKFEKLSSLRDELINRIFLDIDDVLLNGPRGKDRLPGNVNITFKYIEGESILLNLNMMDVAASTGSACASGSLDPSHVILALGRPHELAHGSIRFSLGYGNDQEDIDYLMEVLPGIINRLREMSPLYAKKK